MRYEEYYKAEKEKYIKKISLLKKLFVFIGFALALTAGFIALMINIGKTYESEITGVVYGELFTQKPKSFLASSYYQFKDGDEWTDEAPTLPGEYTYRIMSVSPFGRKMYSNEATFTIDKKTVVVTCANEIIEYGIEPIAIAELSGQDRLAAYEFEYESQVSAKTNVWVKPSSVKIEDENGNDVTKYYIVETKSTPIEFAKVPVVIKLNDAEKPYDGKALDSTSYSLELYEGVEDLLNNDRIEFKTIGSQTYAGSSEIKVDETSIKVYSVDGAEVQNYRVSFEPATLTVKPINLTITTENTGFTYNGDVQSFSTFILDKEIPDSVSITPVECIDVDTYEYSINPIFESDEIKNSYIIKKVPGTITGTKKSVEVTISNIIDAVYGCDKIFTNVSYNVEDNALCGSTLDVNAESSITAVGTGTLSMCAYNINKDGKSTKNNFDITFVDGSITISKKSLTLLPNIPNQEYTGSVISFNGTDSINSDLVSGDTISYTVETQSEAIAVQSLTLTNYSVKHGNTDVSSNYEITLSSSATIEITKRSISITINSSTVEYGNEAQIYSMTGTVLSGHTASFKYKIDGTEYSTNSVTIKKIDSFSITDTSFTVKDGATDVTDDFYEITITNNATLTIEERELTVKLKDYEKPYDGSPLSFSTSDFEITSGSLVSGDSITYTAPAETQTDVGSYTSSLSNSNVSISDSVGDVTAKYNITFVDGTLEVTPIDISISIESPTFEYGQTISIAHTVTGTVLAGHTLSFKYEIENTEYETNSISITDIGTHDITGLYTITDGGLDVSAYYNVEVTDNAKLTITRRNLTITLKSHQKTYDGNSLSYSTSDFVITSGSLVTGDNITYIAPTEVLTNAGSYTSSLVSSNVSINDSVDDVTGKYNITFVNGTLTITPKTLTVVAGSKVAEYVMNVPLTCDADDYATYGELSGHVVTVIMNGSLNEVGTTKNSITSVTVKDGNIDVTSNYNIIKYDGTLTYIEGSE